MIDRGDNVITNASGINSVSTEPVMVQNRRMRVAAIVVFTAALTAVATVGNPGVAKADACSDVQTGVPLPLDNGSCADVLAQEARWLTAITEGDRATIESILSPTYKHITSAGRLLDRAAEIADTKVLLFSMAPSEQIVDVAGDIAVVHGINTMDYGSRGQQRVRFTDVFVLKNGTWMALAAQETAI
jgi:Domain of unknown function (DUF4440)